MKEQIQKIHNLKAKSALLQLSEIKEKLDFNDRQIIAKLLTSMSTASNTSSENEEQISELDIWQRAESLLNDSNDYDGATKLYTKIIEGEAAFLPKNLDLAKAYSGLSRVCDLQKNSNSSDLFLSKHFSSESVKYKNLALRQYEYINENYILILMKNDNSHDKVATIKTKMQDAVKEMKGILDENTDMIGANCIEKYSSFISNLDKTDQQEISLAGSSEEFTE